MNIRFTYSATILKDVELKKKTRSPKPLGLIQAYGLLADALNFWDLISLFIEKVLIAVDVEIQWDNLFALVSYSYCNELY